MSKPTGLIMMQSLADVFLQMLNLLQTKHGIEKITKLILNYKRQVYGIESLGAGLIVMLVSKQELLQCMS